jgi:UDP-glucuronate decarboxylase
MQTAQNVVRTDLDYMCTALAEDLEQLSGKNLLITGGGGFLGYYLVQVPLYWNSFRTPDKHIRVTVYDNFSRGIPDWLNTVRGSADLIVVQHDITNPLPIKIGNYEYIIHAASIASPIYYRKHPIETMEANVLGLRALLEYSRQQDQLGRPISGLLFFSSSEIYGDPTPENIPTPETYRGNVSCTGPRACYDEAKRFGETLCVNYARHYHLPIKIVRPFNNYGPGLKITDRRVIPDFARDILANRDIIMFSDGSQTRTFCYVADAVVGYFKVLVRGKDAHSYNIGVEEPEILISEVADRLATLARDLLGYSGKVVRRNSSDPEYLVDNPSRRCPIIVKARENVGYNPAISLGEGLKRSLLWYDGNREASEA